MGLQNIGLNRTEYDQFKEWLESAPGLPENMKNIGLKMCKTYWSLFQKGGNILQLRKTLSVLMGFTPKSEKGPQATPGGPPVSPVSAVQEELKDTAEKLSDAEKKLADLQQKQKDLKVGVKRYGLEIAGVKRFAARLRLRIALLMQAAGMSSPASEPKYSPPEEAVFSTPVASLDKRPEKKRVDRQPHFGQKKGMHSAYDKTARHEIKVQITTIEYEVETVTDPETGESHRASMDDEGPAGSSLTWVSFATLMKLNAGFPFPFIALK
jgi:hypothetical protein